MMRIAIRIGASLLCCFVACTAQADIKLTSHLVNKAAHGAGVDTLKLVTLLHGPWLRRETHGTGMLADLLSKRVEIINRTDGQRITLDTEMHTFAVDTVEHPGCGDYDLFDLRHLGRRQRSGSMQVSFPDTVTEVLGFAVRPMQLELPAPGLSSGVGTIVRMWLCTAYEDALGSGFIDDLFCGDTKARTDWAGVLQQQFGFTDEVAAAIREQMAGFPLKVEILSGLAGGLRGETVIEASAIDTSPLPESLFAAPEDYTGAKAGGK